MNASHLARPGGILAMRKGWPRAKHVLKHLYRRSERWDLVVEGLPTNLRERSLRAGCSVIDRVQCGHDGWHRLAGSCSRLVEADHAMFYRPAYMRSVETSEALGRVGSLGLGSGRLGFVGDNGVFVIASDGTDDRPPRVVSAYRVSPEDFENATAEEFVEAAVRKWRDKQSLAESLSPQLEELEPT